MGLVKQTVNRCGSIEIWLCPSHEFVWRHNSVLSYDDTITSEVILTFDWPKVAVNTIFLSAGSAFAIYAIYLKDITKKGI